MASLVGATSSNHAEQIELLTAQIRRANAQQIAAEKAVLSYAGQIKNNPTTKNLGKLRKLHAKTKEAIDHACELRRKVNEAEIAYLNPKNNPCLAQEEPNASLENRQIIELDLEEPLGYYPN
jgi:hypothetical protein